MAATSVIANSRNSRSTTPPMNSVETKTTTSARFMATSVKPTSPAPRSAARQTVRRPISRWPAAAWAARARSAWRWMFSSTTMASSTTRPAATISAISDRLLSEKPCHHITAKAPTSETGSASAGISAVRR